MSTLTVEFQFEIGDVVYYKNSRHTIDLDPKPHIVVERIAQQCDGGIQTFYKLGTEKDWAPEIVLTKDMPPYMPIPKERLADIVEIQLHQAGVWPKPKENP